VATPTTAVTVNTSLRSFWPLPGNELPVNVLSTVNRLVNVPAIEVFSDTTPDAVCASAAKLPSASVVVIPSVGTLSVTVYVVMSVPVLPIATFLGATVAPCSTPPKSRATLDSPVAGSDTLGTGTVIRIWLLLPSGGGPKDNLTYSEVAITSHGIVGAGNSVNLPLVTFSRPVRVPLEYVWVCW